MTIYQEICRKIESLTLEEQIQLIEELTKIINHRQPTKIKHSIMELEELGKEIWQSIGAQKYVEQDRQSWNGYRNLKIKLLD